MKVKKKFVKNWPASFPASSQDSKVGGSSGQRLMVARVNIGQEKAAILFRTLSGSTCDNSKILGNKVLLNKVFREKVAAIFAVTLCLTTV